MRYIFFLLVLVMVSCKNETKEVLDSSLNTDSKDIDLEIQDFSGIEKYLYTTTDKTYVVNFWATWCAPCIKELPYFEDINKNYSNKNVDVILVSLDFPHVYETKLKPFIRKNNLKSKVVVLNDMDSNSWIPKVHEDWSGAIPATLIFNKNERKFFERAFTYNELEHEIKQFLK
ncbi:TlpA family protein disulfide reductase [Xanthomarina sp. F2636L]|uniref:TlpA family protein disulfide reductase n=1 Tax=Xanthomarina sp. F2636L TaxID=2996018 RepID=UPI00225E66E0|nr:TlpA disulfide reductase family protein [Xanthomarina sp. F2636L]MCX7551893.1 TlpA disulfide reductase family protein [Xanthomarina sp. F2636L]